MLVSLRNQPVEAYSVAYQGTAHKEESQETVIPDTMPDVGSVLTATGSVLIRSKDVSEGRVRIEAGVPVRIVYHPEDGGTPCWLDVTLPFYMSFEDGAISDRSVCTADFRLLSLEARLLNPRKLSVRVELQTSVACYEKETLALPGAPEDGSEMIQVKEKLLVISPVCALEEKTCVITDEFRFPDRSGPVRALLSQSTSLRTEELRCTGSKVILKGCAESRLLYLTEQGSVEAMEVSTDFSQILEPETLPENAAMDASMLLSGAFYEVDEDGIGGTVELHLVTQLRVFSRQELHCMTDAYSNRYALEPETETREFSRVEDVTTLKASLRESFSTGQSAAEILQCWASFGEARFETEAMLVPMTVILYYRTEEGTLCAARHVYHVRFPLELSPGQSAELLSVYAPILTAVPAAEGAEVRAELEARVLLRCVESEEIVTALSYDEASPLDLSDRPALVLLRTDSGADLWELAKRYCSTESVIRELNAMDDLPQNWEKLLLIPKTV